MFVRSFISCCFITAHTGLHNYFISEILSQYVFSVVIKNLNDNIQTQKLENRMFIRTKQCKNDFVLIQDFGRQRWRLSTKKKVSGG